MAKTEPKKNAEAKQKVADEKATKQKAKKQQQTANDKAKIKSMLSKIADPSQNIHKTVCLNAGILPSTPYSIKFCKWLQDNTVIDENGECDWYTIDDKKNTSIDGKVLKVYKKNWILERSNEKEKKEKEKQEAKEKPDKEKQVGFHNVCGAQNNRCSHSHSLAVPCRLSERILLRSHSHSLLYPGIHGEKLRHCASEHSRNIHSRLCICGGDTRRA